MASYSTKGQLVILIISVGLKSRGGIDTIISTNRRDLNTIIQAKHFKFMHGSQHLCQCLCFMKGTVNILGIMVHPDVCILVMFVSRKASGGRHMAWVTSLKLDSTHALAWCIMTSRNDNRHWKKNNESANRACQTDMSNK
jgi:hypothetical protein